MAGRRVDEVPDNVFQVSGRINSTWGGGLVDMVRSRRLLEIIERDGLIAARRELGAEPPRRAAEAPGALTRTGRSNVRGRGLMCAFDLPDTAERDTSWWPGSGRTRGCSSCPAASGRYGSARRSRSPPTSWERACPPSTGPWRPPGTCDCRPSGPEPRLPARRPPGGQEAVCRPGGACPPGAHLSARRSPSAWNPLEPVSLEVVSRPGSAAAPRGRLAPARGRSR